jgi:hypothetical protein
MGNLGIGHRGYSHEFFNKPLRDVTESDIQTIIYREYEESLTLEFKAIATLEKPADISKEISAFANSSGGLVIVGLSEKDVNGGKSKIATRIDWNTKKAYTKEWFSQKIIANIQPHINNLDFISMKSNDGTSNIFIIDVPSSPYSPHMSCCDDHQYYERIGARSVPMEHYQVDYHFGRRLRPDLIPQIFIENVPAGIPKIKVIFKVRNDGRALAKWPLVKAEFYGCQIDSKYIEPKTNENFVQSGCTFKTPFVQFISSEIAIYSNTGIDLFIIYPIITQERIVIKVSVCGENVVTKRYFGFIYIPGILEKLKNSYMPIELEMFAEERGEDMASHILNIAPTIPSEELTIDKKKLRAGFVWQLFSALNSDKSDEEIDAKFDELFDGKKVIEL